MHRIGEFTRRFRMNGAQGLTGRHRTSNFGVQLDTGGFVVGRSGELCELGKPAIINFFDATSALG